MAIKVLTEREAKRLTSIKPIDMSTTAVYLGKLLIGYVYGTGKAFIAKDVDGEQLGETGSFSLAKDLVTRRPFDLNKIEW